MRVVRPDNVACRMVLRDSVKSENLELELPESFHHIASVGQVIGIGLPHDQNHGIKEGDWLLFPFYDTITTINRTDFVTRTTKGGDLITTCWTHIVQAIITEQTAKDIMAGKKYIDYENGARPIGRKVFIKLDNKTEVTDSGIIIPTISQQEVTTGVIVGLGEDSNALFEREELKMGDRVLLLDKRSGGELPHQDFKKGVIIRTNPQEVIAVLRDGEWDPVGGRLIVEPIIPEYERISFDSTDSGISGVTGLATEAYRIVGSTIIAPGNVKKIPSLGRVVRVGSGYSNRFTQAEGEGWSGPLDVSPGETILLRPMYNHEGKIQFGNDHITIGNKRMILMFANFVDGVIEDEEFLTGERTQEMPKAELWSALDDQYKVDH